MEKKYIKTYCISHHLEDNKTNYNNKHSETRHSVIILNKKAVRSKCVRKKKDIY